MRCGFVDVTKKPNGSHLSGKNPHVYAQNKQDKFARCKRDTYCFLSTFIEFCIMNLFQKDKL